MIKADDDLFCSLSKNSKHTVSNVNAKQEPLFKCMHMLTINSIENRNDNTCFLLTHEKK